MNSVKKNYIFNVIYQLLVILFPLITMPYVSRVIGTNGIGIYSYTHSIAHYFVIFSMLGINNYGNRSIAKCRNNNSDLSRTFFEIYSIQFIMTLLSVIFYFIFVVVNDEYSKIFIVQFIYLFSCFFDINWLYFGLEKFKFTTILNILIKTIIIIFLFLFVKNEDDLIIYTIIMTLSVLVSYLILWVPLRKFISFKMFKTIKINKVFNLHFVSCLKLFIPVIAVSIYKYMDKIMLGIMTNMNNVALYENAEKVVSIPICLITALGTVMLPKIANISKENENYKLDNIIEKTMKFSMFLSFPITFGVAAIGNMFAPIFFGNDFIESGNIIVFLSITNIFISWASVIRMQYLIPTEKDNIYIISVLFGAIFNFTFNYIFIKFIGLYGAILSTIFAEFIVMSIQTFMVRKELNIKKYVFNCIPFFIKALIMYIFIKSLEYYLISLNINRILILLIIVSLGIIIYSVFNLNYILDNIKSMFKEGDFYGKKKC